MGLIEEEFRCFYIFPFLFDDVEASKGSD